MKIARTLFDFVSLQAAWWVTVLGAAAGRWLPGALICLAVLVAQFALSDRRKDLAGLVIAAGLIGLTIESAMIASGLVSYATASPAIVIVPVWLVSLWLAFGTSIRALRRLLGHAPVLKGAALGAVTAIPTYWGGEQLGAMTFHAFGPALLAITIAWIMAMVVLVALDRYLAAEHA